MADYDLGTARGKITIDASTIGRTTASLDKFGKSFLGVGALALGGFAVAVGAAASFEKSLSGTRAVLGGTEQDMENLRKKAFDLGRSSQFTSKEVADGFESMAKAGLHATDIMGGAADAAVVLASAAGDMNLDQASEIMVNAMKTFGLGAKDLGHVADVLAGAANASTVDVDDLAVSMKYAGAVAKTQGVSIDALSTAFAILGDRGIKGSTAGTSMRGVLLSLSPTSKKAAQALKDLGIITKDGANQFFNAKGEMKSLGEVSQILQDHTKGLSQEQKTQAFNTIFQRRAMASALILSEQGAAGFKKYSDEISRVSAAKVAADKLDNLAGRVKILKSSVQTLVIQFGEIFQKMLQGWAEKAIVVVNWLSNLSDGTKKAIVIIVVAVGVLATIIGTMLLAVSAAIKVYKAFKDLQRGIALITKAVKLLNLSFLTSPVFLIIVALVALGVALFVLYKKSETFRNIVDSLWQSLQKVWDSITNAGVAAWHAFQAGVDIVTGAVSAIINFVKANWVDIIAVLFLGPIGIIMVAWRHFGDDFLNFIGNVISSVVGFLMDLPGKAAAALAQLPYAVGYVIGLVLGTIIKFALDGVRFMVEMGPKFIAAIVGFLTQLPGKVASFLYSAFLKLGEFERNALSAAARIGAGILKGIVDFLLKLPGRAFDLLTSVVSTIAGFYLTMFTGAANLGKAIFTAFIDQVTSLPGRMGGILVNIIKAIKDKITDGFNAVKDFASGLWNGFKKGLFGSPRTKIEYAVEAMTDTVGTETARLASQVKQIQRLSNGISDLSPSASLGLAQGAGILKAAGSTLAPFPTAAAPVQEGDTFNITGADTKTALQLSQEIMFEKRVNVK